MTPERREEIRAYLKKWPHLVTGSDPLSGMAADLLEEVDRLRSELDRLRSRIKTTVPYVVATLDIHHAPTKGGEWCEVHRGRASSSLRQLEALERDADAIEDPDPTPPLMSRTAVEAALQVRKRRI